MSLRCKPSARAAAAMAGCCGSTHQMCARRRKRWAWRKQGRGSQTMSSQPTAARVIRFGLFELDLQTSELRKQGRNIKLQDQPFQVLVLLLRHSGEVVTREELRNALWSADTFIEFDQGLNTAIKKIRLALGDAADNPRFIE